MNTMPDVTDTPRRTPAPFEALLPLTTALLEAVTPAEVVSAVVDQGMSVVGARAGLVALVTPDGTELEIVRTLGFEDAVMGRWRRIPLESPVLLADVVRSGVPLLLATPAEWEARYPDMVREAAHDVQASAAFPLIARSRIFGVLHLSFPTERTFGEEDRLFLEALARQCALALDRALLMEQADASNRRLQFLARASGLLAESLDYQETLDAVVRLAVPDLCDWAAVDVLTDTEENGGRIRHLSLAHKDPAEVAWVRRAQQEYPVDMTMTGQPVVQAISTGRTVFLPDIPEAVLLAAAQDEEHLRLIRRLDLHSFLCVPLTARSRTLGAIVLATTRASGHAFPPETVTLIEELARRAAVAMDNADLFQQAQREVRERARAEAQAERIAADLRLITDAAPVLISYVGADLTYRFVNQGYVDWFGRPASEVIGRSVPEVIGQAAWEASRGRVEAALRGEPVTYEALLPYGEGQHPRHVHVDMVPDFGGAGEASAGEAGAREPARGYVAVITEITERVERERRREFLANLTETTRGLPDPDEVLWATATAVGDFMGASRCTYAEIENGMTDAATLTVRRDYTRGDHIRSVAGSWRLLDVGSAMVEGLRAGEVVRSDDTRTDPRTQSEAAQTAFAAIQARAVLAVPVNKGGDLVGAVILHQDRPRTWTSEESEILVTVAERTWLALENARLRRGERDAAVRQRQFLREILFGLTEGHLRLLDSAEELPHEMVPDSEPVALSIVTLRQLRRRVQSAGEALHFAKERLLDLETAVGEAAMNAVKHADGGMGRVYVNRAKGTVQVRIQDSGDGIAEHLIHRAVESGWTTGGFGQGFHLMWKTCDRLYLLTGPDGTIVVIEQDQTPPLPFWMQGDAPDREP